MKSIRTAFAAVCAIAFSLTAYSQVPHDKFVEAYLRVASSLYTTQRDTSIVMEFADAAHAADLYHDYSLYRTAGSVRIIQVKSFYNMRDMGGWKSSFGGRIRYGILFRSAQMDGIHGVHISHTDSLILRSQLGIKADLDLRGGIENDGYTQSPLGADVNYRIVSVNAYADIASKKELEAEAFRFILDNLRQGNPVVFHCVGGADRTGTLAYLMEVLLGVNELDADKDYELTSFSVFGARVRDLSHGNDGLVKFHSYLASFGQKTTYDNVVAFWHSAGITDDEITEFRTIVLNK